MQNEPLEVTLLVTRVFDELGVDYLIGGSLASTLHGLVRTTQDSDIITNLRLEHVSHFIDKLDQVFYIDDEMIKEAISRHGSFNIIHRESMFKVDVFIPKPSPFLRSQLGRAQRQTFNLAIDISAKFASAEDTILAKLDWYRLGGEVSERQWRDILGVLKTQAGSLDIAYLQKWAGELGISDLLERALQASA